MNKTTFLAAALCVTFGLSNGLCAEVDAAAVAQVQIQFPATQKDQDFIKHINDLMAAGTAESYQQAAEQIENARTAFVVGDGKLEQENSVIDVPFVVISSLISFQLGKNDDVDVRVEQFAESILQHTRPDHAVQYALAYRMYTLSKRPYFCNFVPWALVSRASEKSMRLVVPFLVNYAQDYVTWLRDANFAVQVANLPAGSISSAQPNGWIHCWCRTVHHLMNEGAKTIAPREISVLIEQMKDIQAYLQGKFVEDCRILFPVFKSELEKRLIDEPALMDDEASAVNVRMVADSPEAFAFFFGMDGLVSLLAAYQDMQERVVALEAVHALTSKQADTLQEELRPVLIACGEALSAAVAEGRSLCVSLVGKGVVVQSHIETMLARMEASATAMKAGVLPQEQLSAEDEELS